MRVNLIKPHAIAKDRLKPSKAENDGRKMNDYSKKGYQNE